MKNKKIIILTLIIVVLILTIGVSFAIFTYNKVSTNNSKLIVGDIYMHYNETNELTIENAMPSDTFDETKYFEFTIDGKNTYTDKDIWYEIVLTKGNDQTGKTRIKDNLLKFRLTSVDNGIETELLNNKSYDDLTSKRIYVDTINKNTTTEITRTYRLYMWVSSDTKIGNVNQDYTMEEWKDVFASIKVSVTGDFNEKIVTTDESCFTVGTIKTYQLNANMTDEELNKCVTYVTDWSWNDGETPKAFCEGTGTNRRYTFQNILNLENNGFSSEELSYFETNNVIASSSGVAILNYDARCGTDVIIPSTIKGYPVTVIGNINTNIVENLSNDTKSNNLNNLNNYQKNFNVQPIDARYMGSFEGKNLTSIIIPNGVTTISDYAFQNNQITNVVIPDSVTKIGGYAFANNELTNVIIPDSVKYLDCYAFDDTVSITKNDSLVCQTKR